MLCCQVQRRSTKSIQGRHGRFVFNQASHHVTCAVLCGVVQGGEAPLIGGVHISLALRQQLCDLTRCHLMQRR